ncbi:MAG: CinA family protein [Pseudomonadota bacterium]
MNLAETVVARLSAAGLTMTTAESCTGGGVASAITDVAGSSAVFEFGWVTYADRAKAAELGVPEALLTAHGAVSEPVVRAMASGARERSGADLAVAVSGIAGPGGGSPEKPVGLVWFAWAEADGHVSAAQHRFAGDRAAVRQASCEAALEGILARL